MSTIPPFVAGIDLGTTNTLCATWRRGDAAPEVLKINQPATGVRQDGYQLDELLPSAVAFLPPAEGGVIVGKYAKVLARLGDSRVVLSVKRRMGKATVGDALPPELAEWTPERVSGCILMAVRKELLKTFGRDPHRTVITIPASFGTEERRATLRAAKLAGFDMWTTHLFDEPVAALMHHLLPADARRPPAARYGEPLMMIDLGGGTLDVSVLRLSREGRKVVVDILGRSRYSELAGDDFDLNLAGLLLHRYEREKGWRVDVLPQAEREQVCRELLLRGEEAKKVVAAKGGAIEYGDPAANEVRETVKVEHVAPAHQWKGELSLADLWWALQPFFWDWDWVTRSATPDLARCNDYSFFKPVDGCLRNVEEATGSACPASAVKGVFLSGGSAYLPMVDRAARLIFPHAPPVRVARPMHAVALGAAWYAGVLTEGFVDEPVEVRERLYEGVYLQLGGGSFLELLSPRERIPSVHRREGPIRTSKADRRVEFALFSGTSPDDPAMRPLALRRVDFQDVLPEGHPIDLTVDVSRNRQIRIGCRAAAPHGAGYLSGEVHVSAALSWQPETLADRADPSEALGPPLGEVNVPLA